MEVIDEMQAQLGSTLETKPLAFAYLEPLFLHETRITVNTRHLVNETVHLHELSYTLTS